MRFEKKCEMGLGSHSSHGVFPNMALPRDPTRPQDEVIAIPKVMVSRDIHGCTQYKPAIMAELKINLAKSPKNLVHVFSSGFESNGAARPRRQSSAASRYVRLLEMDRVRVSWTDNLRADCQSRYTAVNKDTRRVAVASSRTRQSLKVTAPCSCLRANTTQEPMHWAVRARMTAILPMVLATESTSSLSSLAFAGYGSILPNRITRARFMDDCNDLGSRTFLVRTRT